jgi:hypothetical protein
MSEMTLCNRCSLERARDAYYPKVVEVHPSKKFPGWMAAVVDGEEVAHYMRLTQECAC